MGKLENLFKKVICENCNEKVRISNYKRHKKRCEKGARFHYRKEVRCDDCGNWFKGGRSSSHFRRICSGKKREVIKEKCIKCNREISKSNLKRHENVCGRKHVIRRNNK